MNDNTMNQDLPAAEQHKIEAQRYARLLEWGTRTGLALLMLTFVLYISGVLTPYVALQDLPNLWNQPVDRYLELTNSPRGWQWLPMVMRGDLLNLVGIAVLSGCSIPPLLALIPHFLRYRNRAYAVICALEILLLLLAASGLISGGH